VKKEISKGLLSLASELNVSERDMKKRWENKECIGCGSSSHFFTSCSSNPRNNSRSSSNEKSRKVSKHFKSRNESDDEDENSDNSAESVKSQHKSNFFNSTKHKHNRTSMIKLPSPDDLIIHKEWYGYDTQSNVLLTTDVSITRDSRIPIIGEDMLQSFVDGHEVKIDWVGKIGLCDDVCVVVGARNGIIGGEWLRTVLKLRVEIVNGQPLKIIDRNN